MVRESVTQGNTCFGLSQSISQWSPSLAAMASSPTCPKKGSLQHNRVTVCKPEKALLPQAETLTWSERKGGV